MSSAFIEAGGLHAELARLESLGDNCELGFVLRRLGSEDGMLFRWSSMGPESLLATLRGDFDDLYEFENLVAHRAEMVLDRRYGTAWHSAMTSSPIEGTWMFDDDEARRRPAQRAERAKRAYLVEKLRRKFTHPNPVFVIKCNRGIAPALLEAIHYQLYRRVVSRRFSLLEICEDPDRAGTLDVIDHHRLRGFVSRFASYEDAENADDESWHRVLAQALQHHADHRRDHEPASSPAFDTAILPFPSGPEPALARLLPGDLRTGLGRLLRGNEWCRLVDDDTFRLHASVIGDGATALRWTGIHLPPDCRIQLRARCAIPESKAVRATLRLDGEDGRQTDDVRVFVSGVTGQMEVRTDAGGSGLLSASLTVEPVERLLPSERAVIDIQPIECRL